MSVEQEHIALFLSSNQYLTQLWFVQAWLTHIEFDGEILLEFWELEFVK